MNKCSKIVFFLFCLVAFTVFMGEMEEASVAKAVKEDAFQVQGCDVDYMGAGHFYQPRSAKKETAFGENNHPPVKNFFIRPVNLVFRNRHFQCVYISSGQQSTRSGVVHAFSGRAPPFSI